MLTAKLIAIPLTSAVGVLSATSPLMHIGATKSNWKNKWHERVDFSEPIFKNCKYSGQNPLNVYITSVETGSLGDNKRFSLKVVETLNNGNKKIVWGKGKEDSKDRNWDELKLQYSQDEKEVKFMYPYKNHWGTQSGIAICEDKKIEFVIGRGNFIENNLVPLKEIKLTLTEEKQCKQNFSSVECDIIIGPQEKLKWKDNFQPKVIYTAF